MTTARAAAAGPLADVSLADKYDLGKSRIFISGSQAIVRLLLMQKEMDRRAGLNTAGFVTGYRGSPLGGLDQQFVKSKKLFDANDIHFEPGLNEDLAATAVWGAQQAEMRGEGRYDGVFSIWYGKGPGVDRCGDIFRHANLAGTSKHGGVLALMGDDHTAESSTTAHQSEFAFVDKVMPILSPAGVQEVLDYGLLGWAMSRYTGAWVGLKCVKDTIESTASIDASLERIRPVTPQDFALPPGGLNIRPNDGILIQEARLNDYKRDAMLAWIRANKLNRIVLSGGRNPKLGIVTVGKSYLDVRQALDDLGIDEVRAADLGVRLFKVACPYPMDPRELSDFARGLDLVMVVEEKRSLIEVQFREELYGTANQPVCVGKKDEKGDWLFPIKGALDPNDIAIAIGERVLRFHPSEELAGRVAKLREAQRVLAATEDAAQRIPYFCSGCPHNSSTKVPEGMRAYAGIGCHYMAQWMDRRTEGFTQMGGEGANWIGEAHFSRRKHVFQNLGDGTYNHSGALALRWAVDAGVNVTYKILYNDAVAMTGGQPHEGGLKVWDIARQVAAENVKQIVLVSDEPNKYPMGIAWPAGITFRHRDELDQVQRELADIEGCTVLLYDQTCAAEKRRRRKRGAFPDPDKRVIINELVCEGCGDCGVQSNCVSVQPLETEFGRKRAIDQSNCNKDFSCLKGFCPSFVVVHGARPKKIAPAAGSGAAPALPPAPAIPEIGDSPFGVIVTGVGGTGVVTIGAILGMAAHLEGKGCGMIDMAGLAQKGGAVYSHVKLARKPGDIHAIRVAAHDADLVLGCDLVVSGTKKVLAAVRKNETGVVVNTAEVYPGDFARNADYSLPAMRIRRAIVEAAGDNANFIDATGVATTLLGNAIAANMFMLGFAWQKGLVPLAAESLHRAIELNGEAVAMNKQAFDWGRRAAHDRAAVDAIVGPARKPTADRTLSTTLEETIARRVAFLTDYQNAAYAERYRARVARIVAAEQARTPGRAMLSEAVARYLFKLMAIKDEYEVARLYTDGTFARQVAAAFEGDLKLQYFLAPPLLGRRDPATGVPKKTTFGPWLTPALRMLAKLKGLRGTALDVFGYSAERKMERGLLADYEATLDDIEARLSPDNHSVAVALASLPEKIRGFGHVKERHVAAAKAEEAGLKERWRTPAPATPLAAE
ncbi:MAG: indolepyruvate ferredoxin oxidoreductase family protein [Rhizobiales bacterium]|nr:indolepyruvate ferredoxin oxidoreductase family protein [Hyphomicrobiales bacterium]